MEQDRGHTPLPVIHSRGYQHFSLAIFIFSASVSLLALFYGLLIIYLDRNVWHNHIVRVIIVVQIINCLRFILRTVVSLLPIYSESGCRVLLFLNNALTILPVNLCVYCVVYLQVLVVHKVSPHKRWPRIIFMILAVLMSVIPPTSFLYISPRGAGIKSYCSLSPNSPHRFYVFIMISIALWQYLSGVIGVISVAIISYYIWQARRASRRIEERSTYSYGLPRNIVRQYQSKTLHRTLVTIIWYPITPIVSLWLNLLLYSVAYYTDSTHTGLEFINTVLLGLQSVLLGLGLVVYPAMQKAFNENIWIRWIRPEAEAEATSTNASSEEYLGRRHPPLNHSGMFDLDSTSSDSISDFEDRRHITRDDRGFLAKLPNAGH